MPPKPPLVEQQTGTEINVSTPTHVTEIVLCDAAGVTWILVCSRQNTRKGSERIHSFKNGIMGFSEYTASHFSLGQVILYRRLTTVRTTTALTNVDANQTGAPAQSRKPESGGSPSFVTVMMLVAHTDVFAG